MTRRCLALATALISAGAPVAASAQTAAEPSTAPLLAGPEVTLAETLYREGRRLMAEQRYAEASLKFAESHRLDPATGTLLNLATCYEAQGKLASAWLTFSEALRASRREQREDRIQFVEARIREIEPRLSRLAVEVNRENAGDVSVKLDGVVIGPAAYGVASPIDPGIHRIEASAPEHESWAVEVTIAAAGDRQLVSVPKLAPLAPSVSPPPSVAPEPLRLEVPQRRVEPPVMGDRPSPRPIPSSVFVAGSGTLLLTAGAIVSGIVYLEKRREYSAVHEGTGEPLTTKADAQTWGIVNLGLTAGALVGAGLTVYLYSSRPERSALSKGTSRVAFWGNSRASGLSYASEF